jgi:flagellar hook protein FlgE
VTGVFDNGQTRPLFQLALANFTAPDGLTPLGNGMFREAVDSGSPAIGTPQSGGLGNIVPGAVEQSNVAIAQEFIDLISTQRSFQANARVITSSDQLLTDLINIVR